MQQAKTITAVFGDLHAGSTLAIATPTFSVRTGQGDEQTTQEANKVQHWLWSCWTDYWDWVKSLAGVRGKYRKHRIVALFMGETVDNVHHGTTQVLHDIDDQIDLSANLITPVAALADGGLYGVMGTPAHSGPAGELDRAVLKRVGAKMIDWALSLDIDGDIFDISHHGRAGQRDWTSAASGVAAEVMLEYAKAGKKLPRWILRGHNHTVDDTGERIAGTRCICTPAWQLRTAFGWKVAGNKMRSDIGALVIDGDVPRFERARYHGEINERRTVRV
jgi:hypothetical protein